MKFLNLQPLPITKSKAKSIMRRQGWKTLAFLISFSSIAYLKNTLKLLYNNNYCINFLEDQNRWSNFTWNLIKNNTILPNYVFPQEEQYSSNNSFASKMVSLLYKVHGDVH